MPRPFAIDMSGRAKFFLLFSLMISLFLAALDQTVVITAQPKILAELRGFSLLAWLSNSYMLASTVVVPLVGKLGDLYGRKWFLIGGVLLFIAGSALCGAAPNMESLIAFRAVQGLGSGAIFASVFATLGDAFPPIDRGKYIGLFTATFSLASILGPTLGGFLTDHGGWRWVFYINVPVALVALPALWYNIPARANPRKARLDFLGAAILSVASVMFILAFQWAGDKYAWGSPEIVGLLGGSGVAVAAFIAWELHHPEPIIPMGLFKNRVFLMSNLVVFTFGLGVFGAFQFLGLFVQTALGASATASGIISTPQSAATLVSSIVGGQIITRFGRYKWQTVIGTAFIAVAMALLRTLDADTPKWHISAFVVVLGLGFGVVLPTMSLAVQNAVPPQLMGVATSSSQFFRQIGSVLGVAIFGAILTNVYADQFAKELSAADQATLTPAVVQQLDDPTIRLNKGLYAAIEQTIVSKPDGQALLERSQRAQANSVARAIQIIFTGSLIAAVLSFIFACALKEVPLRRNFPPAGVPQGAGQPPPGAGPAAAPAPGGGAGH